MTEIVRFLDITPKIIPHLFIDNNQNVCFDTANANDMLSKNAVESVVNRIARIARWICLFEAGIKDSNIWELFCGK